MSLLQHISKSFCFGCSVQNLFFHLFAFIFVVTGHFIPVWGLSILRANVHESPLYLGVERSCLSILWCHYLLLPWCYRHEIWHVMSSHTDDVTVMSSMTSLFRKFGRWFSSLDPRKFSHSYSTVLSQRYPTLHCQQCWLFFHSHSHWLVEVWIRSEHLCRPLSTSAILVYSEN